MTCRFLLLLSAAAVASAPAQSGKGSEPARPQLFLREDFKETPAATPITQDHLSSQNVLVAVYGPGKAGMKKSHHDTPADDPYYVWDGTCEGNCGITLRDKANYADLTSHARIRWRTKQSGFRQTSHHPQTCRRRMAGQRAGGKRVGRLAGDRVCHAGHALAPSGHRHPGRRRARRTSGSQPCR